MRVKAWTKRRCRGFTLLANRLELISEDPNRRIGALQQLAAVGNREMDYWLIRHVRDGDENVEVRKLAGSVLSALDTYP